MQHHLVDLYQVCSNYDPGAKNDKTARGGGEELRSGVLRFTANTWLDKFFFIILLYSQDQTEGEYAQEMPQSQSADHSMAMRKRHMLNTVKPV